MTLRTIAELMADDLLRCGDGPRGRCERIGLMIRTGHLQEFENCGMGRAHLENTLISILHGVMRKTQCQIIHTITTGGE